MSPLFAIEAEKLLNEGKVQQAIDLCLEGLAHYPKYASAEAVLARAYKMSGDDKKASETLEKALKENPLNRTFKSIKEHNFVLPEPVSDSQEIDEKDIKLENTKEVQEIENIEKDIQENIEKEIEEEIQEEFEEEIEELEISASDVGLIPGLKEIKADFYEFDIDLTSAVLRENIVDASFISTSIIEEKILEFKNKIIEESVVNEEEEILEIEIKESDNQEFDPIEKLALQLEDAKIIPSDGHFPEPYDDDKDFFELDNESKLKVKKKISKKAKSKKKTEEPTIVTETIAELYYEQEAFEEAEKAYRKLARTHPDKAKEYRAKARNIRKEIK